MTILRWSMVASLNDPIFLVATLLFIALAGMIAYHLTTPYSAMEIGAIYGFVYGVVVWGMLGYAYGFDGQAKLLFAGSSIVDGLVLCTVLQIALRRWVHKEAGR